MTFSENGGGRSDGGSVLAVLADAYASAPDVDGDESAAVEATEAAAEHVQTEDAGQASDAAAPATDDQTASTEAGTQASETAQPFRVFASEDEYRQHLEEYAKRERAAQSALDAKTKELTNQLEAERQKATALERWRNEIYTRAQSEELSPRELMASFIRLEGETKQEFEARKADALREAAAEAQRERDGSLVQTLSRKVDEAALTDRAYALSQEIGKVEGLDLRKALDKAINDSADAQRYARLSHTAMTLDADGKPVPDFATRQWAADEAYRIGGEQVRKHVETLRAQIAEKQKGDAEAQANRPATTIHAAASTGYDGTRFKNPLAALEAAYSS